MKVRIFQKGFNYSQDGPGNRLVYHLQGCNFRCPWCSNPEGLPMHGGEDVEVDAILDEVLRSRLMFFDGGGVTLTGGEATLQFDAIKELLTKIHAEGIHTCMETNGANRRLPELFPVLDELIMDMKHYAPETHCAVIGHGNAATIENAVCAMENAKKPALRIPLIGGFNASAEDAQGFVKLFTDMGVKNRATVELLPYHEFGKCKYERLGMEYSMTDEARISKRQLETFRGILLAAGFDVIHT